MCDGVGAIIPWHEFHNVGLAFAFVVLAVVLCVEHDKVTNLVHVFWCTVFIGMVGLSDFGSEEVVLCLLDIKYNRTVPHMLLHCFSLNGTCLFVQLACI